VWATAEPGQEKSHRLNTTWVESTHASGGKCKQNKYLIIITHHLDPWIVQVDSNVMIASQNDLKLSIISAVA